MFVSMWMAKDVITVKPEVSVIEIARIMAAQNIRRVPVVDSDEQLIGLVSAQELLHAFPADVNPFVFTAGKTPDPATLKLTAADIMLRAPITTAPETPIEDVAKLMLQHKLGAVLVTRHEHLLGVITESDIFRAFAELFDPGTRGVRVTFDNTQGQDAFPLIAEVTHRHRLRVMSFVSMHKHARPLCVVQVTGSTSGIEAMLEDLWKSHHQVVSVIHLTPADGSEAAEQS
jgi:acetoin utilization protein AcuB